MSLTPTILTSEDLNAEVLEAIERFELVVDLNEARNPDAEFELALYNPEDIDHDLLDGHIVFRSYSYDSGSHVFDMDGGDILGFTYEAPLVGYLVSEDPSFRYDADGTNIYELQQDTGNVLYTGDLNEIKYILENEELGYDFAGFAFRAGVGEVQRLWNEDAGRHHFTGDIGEAEFLIAGGEWVSEGTL